MALYQSGYRSSGFVYPHYETVNLIGLKLGYLGVPEGTCSQVLRSTSVDW